jgi:hypothetical protein
MWFTQVVFGLFTNIRLGCKDFARTTPLAYYKNSLNTPPGDKPIKNYGEFNHSFSKLTHFIYVNISFNPTLMV